MAIFDSEKRPRGLRVPSLTAMKNGTAASKSQFSFHSKKSNDSQPDSSSTPSLTTIVPAPVLPQTTKDLPPAPNNPPNNPPNKDLPPTPKEEMSQSISAPPPPRSSSMVPQHREILRKPPPPPRESPVAEAPKTGLRQASQQSPAAGTNVAASPQSPAQSQSQSQPQSQFQPRPAQSQTQAPLTQSLPVYHSQTAYSNQASRGPVPPPPSQSPPSHVSAPPADLPPAIDSSTPLEDFIPTPEEDNSTPLDQTSSDEQTSYTASASDLDPIAAPLNKIHYACFQEHRNMPVAQNTWCPVPCMTCQKADREIRHRCVFCCLRVCEGCFLALQRCRGRSLGELMGQLG